MAGSPVVIVAPSIVRYTFQHLASFGHKADNVVDVSVDPTGLLASRDASVDDFNSHIAGYWQDNMLPKFPSVVSLTGVAWIDLNSSDGRTGHLGPAGGHPTTGADAGPVGALAPCHLVHKNTISGRGHRQGRMYLGPITENGVDDGGLVPSSKKTSWESGLAAFRSDILGWNTIPAATAAWRVVHVHKPDKTDHTTWTWSSSDVDSATIDPMVATQRRRQRP